MHNGSSLFNCRYCTAGFDSEYAYKKHLKSHPRQPTKPPRAGGGASSSSTPQPPHPCSVCELSFQDVEQLMTHYRSEEHQEKVTALGLDSSSTMLHSIEGELSPEIRWAVF